MLKYTAILLAFALALFFAPSAGMAMAANQTAITPDDNQAKRDVITSLSRAVENHFGNILTVNITTTDNNNSQMVYNRSAVNEPPPPADNKPPLLVLDSPVKCIIDEECQITIDHVEDHDGNVTGIVWKQNDNNAPVDLKVSSDGRSAIFTPMQAGAYKFSVTATDNDKASTTQQLIANVPNQQPQDNQTVPPKPQPKTTDVIFLGDVKGTAVFDAAKKANAALYVVSGDLFYGSDLSQYRATYGTLNNKCNQGNHDSTEDGTAKMAAETLKYCGSHWYYKLGNGTTLIFGFTTQGNDKDQATFVNNVLANGTVMQGVKNVIYTSHKGGHSFPNAHHGAEAAALYSSIKMPAALRNLEITAHDHNLASADTKDWYVSGAGGKSHYNCGTNQLWTFCDDSNYGYLKMTINNENGALKLNFYDIRGKILH